MNQFKVALNLFGALLFLSVGICVVIIVTYSVPKENFNDHFAGVLMIVAGAIFLLNVFWWMHMSEKYIKIPRPIRTDECGLPLVENTPPMPEVEFPREDE